MYLYLVLVPYVILCSCFHLSRGFWVEYANPRIGLARLDFTLVIDQSQQRRASRFSCGCQLRCRRRDLCSYAFGLSKMLERRRFRRKCWILPISRSSGGTNNQLARPRLALPEAWNDREGSGSTRTRLSRCRTYSSRAQTCGFL